MKQQSLHTELVRLGDRSFFFDIKESEKGKTYMSISLTQKKEDGTYNRDQIVVFDHEMVKFGESMMRAMINFKPVGREAIIAAARTKYPNAFAPWSKEDDRRLADFFAKGISIENIAKDFGRNTNAINARIEKLNLNIVS